MNIESTPVTVINPHPAAGCWDYFLEDPDGNVIEEMHNVPKAIAPRGEDWRDVDGFEVCCHWHPFLP